MKPISPFCLALVLMPVVIGLAGEPEEVSELNRSLLKVAADGDMGLVEALVSKGADVNSKDVYGLTPLHVAATKGQKSVIDCLLARGTHVDPKDNAGRTPLHYAAGAGSQWRFGNDRPDMVELLLDKGANANAIDNRGWTPLHYATGTCCEATIEILVNGGADLGIADQRGRTALSLAQRMSSLRRRTYGQIEVADRYGKIADFLSKHGCVYCVATNGEDCNPGNVQQPFRTLAVAISVAEPGDTILVRGGTHSCSSTLHIDKSGEQDRRIRLEAYPGETPVLDFSKAQNEGFLITGAYWRLRKLSVMGAEHWGLKLETQGAHHNVLEQVTTQANGVTGIALLNGAAHNLVIDCDSFQNFDIETNGENADGFEAKMNLGEGNVFIGCRAWNNADDGFDLWDSHEGVRLERCYAWANGENIWDHPYFKGNANGFKLGAMEGAHVLIRCATWGQPRAGFDLNGNSTGVTLHNCTGVKNQINFAFRNTGGNTEKNVLRNSLSYKGSIQVRPEVDDRSNSWNTPLGIEITEKDFLSLDDTAITGLRNPDGSIPESDFLRLAPDSDAIDAGTDVGLPFAGKAPDLGAFECDPEKAQRQSGVKWLHQAVRDHDIQKIRSLLSGGTDANEKDWLGYAPLHWACYFGYADVVELLLENGADSNLTSDTGRTPLKIAQAMDYENVARLLRRDGAKE